LHFRPGRGLTFLNETEAPAMTTSREIHLAKRPDGLPELSDFRLVERDLPALGEGEVLIKQIYMSVDPAMRPRLSTDYKLDEALFGGAIGRIEASNNEKFAVGDVVHNQLGFRDFAVSNGEGLRKVKPEADIPLSAYMSVMGGTGLTAYQGIVDVAKVKEGEQVFVSAAAGAVGSIAAQIAKIKGCYGVGSAGSDDKVAWLKDDLGLDAAFNYKAGPVNKSLRGLTPKGLDAYFDNVGGEHLDAALAVMNVRGRVAACGMISGYNEHGAKTSVHNLANIIYGRISILGFVVFDFMHFMPQFQAEMAGWIREGKIKYRETILKGIDEAPHAMVGLMRGENTGKMLVEI
jgi:NADPH-dependent curcumin reductase CurA